MMNNKTIEGAEEYVKTIAEIVDMIIDGVLSVATEMEIDEMRDKVQELLNI